METYVDRSQVCHFGGYWFAIGQRATRRLLNQPLENFMDTRDLIIMVSMAFSLVCLILALIRKETALRKYPMFESRDLGSKKVMNPMIGRRLMIANGLFVVGALIALVARYFVWRDYDAWITWGDMAFVLLAATFFRRALWNLVKGVVD